MSNTPEPLYEIVILRRPVPTKDAHLIDLTAREQDDVCVAEGTQAQILIAFETITDWSWQECKRRNINPPEDADEEEEEDDT